MQFEALPGQSLWRDRSFVLFWLARTVSIAGTTVTAVVLPILVYRLTGSPFQTAILTALEVVPYFVFGLFAGALADRVDRRRLMVMCDLVNVALIGSVPLAALGGVLTLWQIYVVAFLSMSVSVWFDAANFGALLALVGRDRLIAANSALLSTSTIISILGPAVGGALAALLGPAPALMLDAVSFAASAALLAYVPHAFNNALVTEPGDAAPDERGLVQRTLADIREGLVYLWQQRLVRALTLLGFGVSLTGGAVTGMLVVYGVQALGLQQDDARIGWLFTAGAVGALGASLALPQLSKRLSPARITLVALVGDLVLLLGIVIAPTLWVGLLCLLLWNACHTLIVINGIALRQIVTPAHLQGRVNTTARMIAWGGAPFGAAIGGLVAEATDIRTAYLIMAFGVALSALIGWLSPLRHNDAVTIPGVAANAIE